MKRFHSWILFHSPVAWLARLCDFISDPIRKAQMQFIFASHDVEANSPPCSDRAYTHHQRTPK
jgi:hypothetical protein